MPITILPAPAALVIALPIKILPFPAVLVTVVPINMFSVPATLLAETPTAIALPASIEAPVPTPIAMDSVTEAAVTALPKAREVSSVATPPKSNLPKPSPQELRLTRSPDSLLQRA